MSNRMKNDETAARARPPATRRNKTSAEDKLKEVKRRFLEISDLGAAGSVLSWDQATYMPPGGAPARARQGATLRRLAHERMVDPTLGKLLDDLQSHAESLPADSDDARLVAVARRDFERAIRVPGEYVARASAHGSATYDAWTRARPDNDFASMRPLLEQALDLSREYAEFFAPYRHIADPLIDDAEHGMTADAVSALFGELRAALVPLTRAIAERPAIDDTCLTGSFASAPQIVLGRNIAADMGYDLERGRLDETHHPFCTTFSAGDVRITTRVDESNIGEALFSTLHEAGHALYEQGVDPALEGAPLGSGTSAGVHESQSRLWENVVARSRAFWEHYYPLLQRTFPEPYGRVTLDAFYLAINKVQRSLIRTDADEVTYNLHIMLRFDLELRMLEGRLAVKDLPEAWRAAMEADLGIVPPDDRDGCLQDVHWYSGGVGGAFQSYTIGNVLSAQFYAAATRAHPDIPREIAMGRFATLHAWLRDNIYRHGRKYAPDELVVRATGEAMSTAPYLAYLRGKYGEIYGLP
jgi:carboxypeptidase Taq